jgi:transaldolase
VNIFLDTANLEDIQRGIDLGCVSGVTANPSIISREKKPYEQCIEEIVRLDENLTILVEVKSNETQQMIDEAKHFSTLGKRIVIKIPMTAAGMSAIPALSAQGITNCVTLVFSPNQAIVASCTGADYVAPFD